MRYNLSEIMKKAWELYRKAYLKIDTFGEALHRAWEVTKYSDEKQETIENTATEKGITEEYHTWYGWTLKGRKVKHEEKAVFQVMLKAPEKGDGKTFLTSFFTYSQTDLAENVA